MHLESSGMPIVRRILHARAAPATRARGAVILGGMFVLSALFWPLQASAAAPETPPACLISPAYDPGVGELYVCPPTEAEQHLITYARRSYTEAGPLEDIWANFHGVFGNLVWINVGMREANDTSLLAWNLMASLLDRFRAIKAGDTAALQVFLAPIAAAQTSTEADRLLQQRLLTVLSDTAREPVRAPLRVVLYHVHLRPTRDIEARSLMPINHVASIPSHGDLLYAPRLQTLASGSEAKIAVAAGMWTYAWDEAQAHRFVADQYDGPEEVPWASKYAHVYTRFAITTYHQYGLNAPAKLTPARLDRYIETLRPTGARLHFAFAPDWATVVHRSWLTAAPQVALWTAGKQVYEANCAVCHGLRGDGQGMAAHMFRTPPRDFRTGVFKFRSTPVGSLPRDADLLRVLQRGVRRTAMVAQTHLTEAEQRAAIAYLKTFSPRWREEEPEPSVPIPELPPKTAARIAQGKQLYQEAGCAQCHGPEGLGDGRQAGDLRDDWDWPIRPANLQQRPFKSGPTLRDLYRTLATGLDGTPMPSVGEALSPDELWALVYYVDALAPARAHTERETLVGEEARGLMVERMHGRMGGMRGRMPMTEHMMRRRPMR